MKRINAPTIQEAIKKASDAFACSVVEIDYEVITPPRSGFLGLFKREALIVACRKNPQQQEVSTPKSTKEFSAPQHTTIKSDEYNEIENNFFKSSLTSQEIAQEITQELIRLFGFLPYEVEKIKVRIEGNQLASVEFFGNDCGLLIGEKGYRYSAIYYLLSIWIKKDYGMSLKLEIADFLKNKERKIEEYLEENYDKMISRNFFQTKSFDSISIHIALKRFREAIPNKYIVAKAISENESVIVLNDFRSK